MRENMGTFRVGLEVANPARPGEWRTLVSVLVDTGAELSWFPTTVLESLGIERVNVRRFRQADGTILDRWTGGVILRVAGVQTWDEVVFTELGDLTLLGARSLEGLNLRVDPITHQLIDAGPAPAAVGSLTAAAFPRRSPRSNLSGGSGGRLRSNQRRG
jgi:predicted aspartyl protease